jgi:hypothetical protein
MRRIANAVQSAVRPGTTLFILFGGQPPYQEKQSPLTRLITNCLMILLGKEQILIFLHSFLLVISFALCPRIL